MFFLWICVIVEALAAAVFQLQLNQMHWDVNAGVGSQGLLAALHASSYQWHQCQQQHELAFFQPTGQMRLGGEMEMLAKNGLGIL